MFVYQIFIYIYILNITIMFSRIKILCVIGTRPEAIKMAPVIKELLLHSSVFDLHVCSTGQHLDMLNQVLNVFNINTNSELKVMQHDQSLTSVTSLILQRISPLLNSFKPDWMLVQGDTVTVAASSLAAFYNHVKVGHIEAGLRSNDRLNPYPEEINRRLTSVIANRHFATSRISKENLIRENISSRDIIISGNTVVDSLLFAKNMDPSSYALKLTDNLDKRILFVTIHRRENLGEPLTNILNALKLLAILYRNSLHIIFPVHLNPNVYEPVKRTLSGESNISLVEPLDYFTLIHVISKSYILLTDSGGLQEEAPTLGKPVFILRKTTERPEAILAGVAKLVGTESSSIVKEVSEILDNYKLYLEMSRPLQVYGDGLAAKRIVASLSGSHFEEFNSI